MQNEPWQSPDTQPLNDQQQPHVPPQQPQVDLMQEETAPIAQPIQPALATPASPQDVWISKEEYERLRQAEAAQTRAQMHASATQKGPIGRLLIAAVAISALVFISGFFNPTLAPMAAFGLVMLVISAAFSLNDYATAKKEGMFRPHKTRNMILFILTLVVVALPVLAVVGMILLFVVMCGMQSCRGS